VAKYPIGLSRSYVSIPLEITRKKILISREVVQNSDKTIRYHAPANTQYLAKHAGHNSKKPARIIYNRSLSNLPLNQIVTVSSKRNTQVLPEPIHLFERNLLDDNVEAISSARPLDPNNRDRHNPLDMTATADQNFSNLVK